VKDSLDPGRRGGGQCATMYGEPWVSKATTLDTSKAALDAHGARAEVGGRRLDEGRTSSESSRK
jgi:hypothetical protein